MELENIREKIDEIDTQMKELFLKRMELSSQVIAAKKETGGAVYVPLREQEILKKRSIGISEELVLEYQMFIRQLMNISRTYQYSKITDVAEELFSLPEKEGEMELTAVCRNNEEHIIFMLNALILGGLSIKNITKIQKSEEENIYKILVTGDFSKELAKGAVLQFYREME